MATFNLEDYKKRAATRIRPISVEDEIVITGVSGKFPNADNVEELSEKLYNKVDLVDDSEIRWRHTNPEVPRRMGKISGLEKFDATFFGVHFRQAHTMDPQCRMLLEHAYAAVIDAGINPKALRGTKTGVFIGACFAESEKTWFYEKVPIGGVGLTGCARAMLANRISYTMGLKGPSFLLDTACSSSMYGMDMAFNCLRNGECDAALVGGVNLLLHPHVTMQFARLGVLSDDGYCRPFDEKANGYTRSEAVCVIFLQRARDAKRIYGTVVYSKTNCDGFKEEGITYPAGKVQAELMRDFYEELQMDPREVDFVEAHATGTVVGDPEECQAIDEVFCTGRSRPLPVGSIKSNIGHSESTSGCCSITKAILAYHNNLIPPNIHFESVRTAIPSLTENRLKVITEPTPLEGPMVAINSFGFGGANAHLLLRGHMTKKVNKGVPGDLLPRLVIWSGRTEEACDLIFDDIVKRPLDAEHAALLNNIHTETVPANIFRGYGVFVNDETAICVGKEVKHHTGLRRPLVYVFSGMGSQWNEMGAALMELPVFNAIIQKLHATLAPKGINLIEILTSTETTMFDNILNSFIGITAVQIAITDVLNALNMAPDYIIGHSMGELGCAYADGCLTAEEAILCTYSRGMASIETQVIVGSMAAIGMGYQKIRTLLPPGIEAACRNGPDSCTISGPAELVSAFVADLKSQGVFAKEVPCSNIAYHSKYIADMGPNLLRRLREVIKDPKPRTARWLSTSVPKSKWDLPENQICSAEYQTNNLLSSVFFEETSALLPKNSLTIEIAPHGLLQAILKKSMPDAIHVGLTKRGAKENLQVFCAGLGRIYLNGVDMPVNNIYPEVKFPVSCGTPMISSLVRWDHSEDWFLAKYDNQKDGNSAERTCKISLTDHDFEYVSGHVVDGRVLFPATAYLHLIWETLGMMLGQFFLDLHVEFEDVKFLRATVMPKDAEVVFVVIIHRGTGRFEITESSTPVVTGIIRVLESIKITETPTKKLSSATILDTRDFYKELRLRGYHYNGEFKNILEARSDGLGGRIAWNLNFASFMDGMLQVSIVGNDTRNLLIPTGIDRIRIDAMQHFQMAKECGNAMLVEAIKELQIVKAGGIEMKGLRTNTVSRRKPPGIPVLEEYAFIPHFPTPRIQLHDAARIFVQIAQENTRSLKVKSVEVDADRPPIVQHFHEAFGDLPLVASESILLSSNRNHDLPGVQIELSSLKTQSNCNVVIATHLLSNSGLIGTALQSLKDFAYLVTREAVNIDVANIVLPSNTKLVCVAQTEHETLLLFQYQKIVALTSSTVIKVSSLDSQYKWLDEVKTAISTDAVVLVAQNETYSGILGLTNCIRAETSRPVTCVFIDDPTAPPFDLNDPFYQNQLGLGLAINVYRKGQWGTYRHLLLPVNDELRPEVRPCYINALTKGDLSSLKWQERIPLTSNKEVVRVQYASLNFRDVMLASGKLSDDFIIDSRINRHCVLGFEYSGVTLADRRVMGMVVSGALATHIEADMSLAWEVPSYWSLEDAATVPVVYCTVYTCFFLRTQIQQGKKVLIHAGTGGVGLAAIRVALAYGLEVFTTVSTQEKREYLLEQFPQLKASRIGNSRDLSFYEMVMLETNGTGVDYVLNSLAEDKLLTSVRCLGKGGHFLEIGKYDITNDNKIGLGHFINEISFHAIMVDNLFHASDADKKVLFNLIARDIRSGIIVPLKANLFPAKEVEQAFRFLASGKHKGKVVLKIREEEKDPATLPIQVLPRIYFNPSMTYIIPGGLGGFGLELADWLVIRGCQKIVLSSSRGITKPYQKYRIDLWKSYGVQVVVSVSDITTPGGCMELINEAIKLGPVGGIFNLAVQLRDAILENQDATKFSECLAVKAVATKYLDEISQRLCPQLQHFVVFSSVSCGRGNTGQTNYGFANSIMERIIETRKMKGLPAKAIQWGAIGEVGLVADMQEDKLDCEIGGTLQQRISSCMFELDTLLACPSPIVGSMVVAEKRASGSGKGDVVEAVMNIMSLRDIKSISMDTKLSELGMDSLMAVELKQTLERDFELFLTAQDIRGLTFAKLRDLVDGQKDPSQAAARSTDGETGITLLLRHFGDETYSGDTLLSVETRQNDGRSAVIIVPGIEGTSSEVYHNLARGLNLPAFILQLTHTGHLQSISDIVQHIFDEAVETLFKGFDYFYLVGYSFGAFITLELAAILEKRGLRGNVVLIDGSPIFLKRIALDQVSVMSDSGEEGMQNILLMTAIRLQFPGEEQETWNAVAAAKGWEARVEKLIELVAPRKVYSIEYSRAILNALLRRMIMAMEYNEENHKVIQSNITLIRPSEVSLFDIDEDYGLAAYTTGQVALKFIEGNHATILENPKLQELINENDPFKFTERPHLSQG